MKTLATLLALALSIAATAQIGIGTTTPDSTSVLDVSSTSKAVVIPRLSATAMNAIQNPVEGSMVYNTTVRRFFGYGGTGTSSTAISQTTGTTPQAGSISTLGQSFTVASPGFFVSSADVFFTGGSAGLLLIMTLRTGAGLTGTSLAGASASTGAFGSSGPLTFSFGGTPLFLPGYTPYACTRPTAALGG